MNHFINNTVEGVEKIIRETSVGCYEKWWL